MTQPPHYRPDSDRERSRCLLLPISQLNRDSFQSVSTLKSGSAVSEEDILEVSGFIKLSVIDRWLQVCASGSFERVQSFVQGVIADGYAANQLFSQLHDAVVYLDRLDDPKKAKVLEKLSMCDRRLMDGASEYLQLMDVSCEIMRQSC